MDEKSEEQEQRIYRALAYHAALLTHLMPGYDHDCFGISERADALHALIVDYATAGSGEASEPPPVQP